MVDLGQPIAEDVGGGMEQVVDDGQGDSCLGQCSDLEEGGDVASGVSAVSGGVACGLGEKALPHADPGPLHAMRRPVSFAMRGLVPVGYAVWRLACFRAATRLPMHSSV